MLVNVAAWLFPEFKFQWLIREMKNNLPLELDFLHEGRNAERVRRMFSHLSFLKIPEINWDLSSDRILTMEFCEGGQVNDRQYLLNHGISAHDVCRMLGRLYSEMIFVQGYVHCDPHPGNVLVYRNKRSTQLVLLDHGLYTTLTDEFRLMYSNLWLALLRADMDGLKHWSEELGVGNLYGLFACMLTARSWKSVTTGIRKAKATAEENDEIKVFVGSYLPQISEVLDRVPRPMLLIFKTNDLLRGIEYSLETQGSAYSFLEMSRCCARAVHDHALQYECSGLVAQVRTLTSLYWTLFGIWLYEWWLRVREWVGQPAYS